MACTIDQHHEVDVMGPNNRSGNPEDEYFARREGERERERQRDAQDALEAADASTPHDRPNDSEAEAPGRGSKIVGTLSTVIKTMFGGGTRRRRRGRSILLTTFIAASVATSTAACSSTTSTGTTRGGGDAGGGSASAGSASGGSSSTCVDISGNWKVTSTRTDGDCDQAKVGDAEGTATMRKAASGDWLLVVPGVEGGCPGTLDSASCTFVANCNYSSEGEMTASIGVDWTFTGKTMSGSQIARYLPPLVPAACTANYADTGVKL